MVLKEKTLPEIVISKPEGLPDPCICAASVLARILVDAE